MNINIDDNEYKPDLGEGVPTPNQRQAVRLGEMIDRQLVGVIKDVAHDPDCYLPRFYTFAATLKGAWASKVLADGARKLAIIKVGRKRAQRYVDQILDAEIRAALDDRYGDAFSYPIDYERARLLECATGVSETWGYQYKYRSHDPYGKQSDLHNVLFKNAQEFGKALPTYQFIERNDPVELPSPIPDKMVQHYNKLTAVNRRKKAVKEASESFSQAYFDAKKNITVADRLFAERFRLMWELVDAQAKYEALESKLTKPLEDYAAKWHGYGRYRGQGSGHFEYQHKGAETTRIALRQLNELRLLHEDNEERIFHPGWSISTLVREAWDKSEIFDLIIADDIKKTEQKQATDIKKTEQKQATDAKKQAAREEKLRDRISLAEKPVEVPAVRNDDGLWLDHRALIEGLKGRVNVTKRYGRSYLKIEGVVMETTKLKQWLAMALQDPNTNRRIPKNKWQQVQWAHVGVGQAIKNLDYANTAEVDSLYFLTQVGGMRVTTRFYDQADDFDYLINCGQEPVLNKVEPVEVKAVIPEHRGVWTPEDINKYHPV